MPTTSPSTAPTASSAPSSAAPQAAKKPNLDITTLYDAVHSGITLEIVNRGEACDLTIFDAYTTDTTTHHLRQGEELSKHWHLRHSHGWYDFIIKVNSDISFQRRIAGHVETGENSMTDPAIGAPVEQSQKQSTSFPQETLSSPVLA